MANISGWNFDWDDNVFYMPTKVILYHTVTDEERAVSTAVFAGIRDELGQAGEWLDYEVRDQSFRFFRDSDGGRNYFREDIDKAVGRNDPTWIGPSWRPFLFALNHKATAERVSVITARGHSKKRC